MKNKKAIINPKNNDENCFQYAVALNHQNIENNPQRISKIKLFVDQYNWKEINFPWHSKDWKKYEQNKKIALDILLVPHNTKQARHTYKSKHNFKCENQVILLMITDSTKWHLTVKSFSALHRGITSNHNGDFYCLNCFHWYSTKEKLEKYEKVCNDHDYCYVELPNDNNKILKYNHGEKSMRAPLVIYIDLECLLEKCIPFKIILKNLTQKKNSAYTFWLLIAYKLFIWWNKKQTWLLQKQILYGKVL